MEIAPLFSIPIGKQTLNRSFTDDELTAVMKQPRRTNVGNETSENNYVLEDPVFSSLKSFANTSLNEFLKQVYSPKSEVELRITQSWFNYSSLGQYHHKHSHANSLFSGVLYIKTATQGLDKITFHREQYKTIEFDSSDWNLYNSHSWFINVKQGDLLIFPSSLVHNVEPVQEERISLSFNSFAVGMVGVEDRLTALHLR